MKVPVMTYQHGQPGNRKLTELTRWLRANCCLYFTDDCCVSRRKNAVAIKVANHISGRLMVYEDDGISDGAIWSEKSIIDKALFARRELIGVREQGARARMASSKNINQRVNKT